MSFILDALKKSENERQRRVGPSLADVQVRRRNNHRPWWAVGVAALLLVNLVVLIVVLARNSGAPEAVAAPAQVQAPTPGAAPSPPAAAATPRAPIERSAAGASAQPQAADRQPLPQVRSLADEAGPMDYPPEAVLGAPYGPDLSAAAAVPEGPPMVRSITPSPALETSPAPASRQGGYAEVLPTHSDLTASGTALPPLHLDMHVHSPTPADRFVFINMRKYTEGQALNEGPLLERITAEGAVLNHQGLRFLLPRQ